MKVLVTGGTTWLGQSVVARLLAGGHDVAVLDAAPAPWRVALPRAVRVAAGSVADPGAGQGEELRIIAACIIGGCSLRGGKGTVIGGLLGLIFVGFINNGLILLRVPVYYQQLAMGVVLLLAVGFDTLSQRWQTRSRGKRAG